MPDSQPIIRKASGRPTLAEPVHLSVDEAKALGVAAVRGAMGYTADEAAIIIDQLIDNELCDYSFTGLSRIVTVSEQTKAQEPRRPMAVVHETDVSATIDGGNNVGYLVAYRGMELAIEKARARGFAITACYNSYISGRNGYYLEKVAEAGLVGIHTASAWPRVAPLGGRAPALGTNPIAFGFPSDRGPIVFDMGTASVMWGDLKRMAALGELLPSGIGLDPDGNPTRDPAAAEQGAILPFGGHKGYGLAFSIQALGVIAGAHRARGRSQDYGFLFMVFAPELLLPKAELSRWTAQLVEDIKNTPRQPGVDEILIPSERAFRARERNRKSGIAIERTLYDRLKAMGAGPAG